MEESERATTLCANPDCWRRLCRDPNWCRAFCCGMCEQGYYGEDPQQSHGCMCCKKEKPPEDAPRAMPERTPGGDDPSWAVSAGKTRRKTGGSRPADGSWSAEEGRVKSVIWEATSRFISDEGARAKLDRFLWRCWSQAKEQAEADEGARPLDKIKSFVRLWISDAAWRYQQSSGDFGAGGLSASTAVSLWQNLCQSSALPNSLVRDIGPPPDRWPYVKAQVLSTFQSLGLPVAMLEIDAPPGRHSRPSSLSRSMSRSRSPVRARVPREIRPASLRRRSEAEGCAPKPRERSSARRRSALLAHPNRMRGRPMLTAASSTGPSRARRDLRRVPEAPRHVRYTHGHTQMQESEEEYEYEDDEVAGTLGCNSGEACVGMTGSRLYTLTGGYVGVFCERCVQVLEDADGKLEKVLYNSR